MEDQQPKRWLRREGPRPTVTKIGTWFVVLVIVFFVFGIVREQFGRFGKRREGLGRKEMWKDVESRCRRGKRTGDRKRFGSSSVARFV